MAGQSTLKHHDEVQVWLIGSNLNLWHYDILDYPYIGRLRRENKVTSKNLLCCLTSSQKCKDPCFTIILLWGNATSKCYAVLLNKWLKMVKWFFDYHNSSRWIYELITAPLLFCTDEVMTLIFMNLRDYTYNNHMADMSTAKLRVGGILHVDDPAGNEDTQPCQEKVFHLDGWKTTLWKM